MIAYYVKYQEKSHVSKPKNYAEIKQADFIGKIPVCEKVESEGIRPTNIIMIMNESYSDLRMFKEDYGTDITPFYDSLNKNVIKGNLYVSVRGGGTCNTEFESLTGSSLVFLPPGSTPYQTSVHKDVNSIVSFLKENGYATYGVHIAQASNWNRKNVYPLLGFEQFYSENDFDEIETTEGWQQMRKIIEE